MPARGNRKTVAPPVNASRLQIELAGQILAMLKEQGAGLGHHLVEVDLCHRFAVSRTPIRGALNLLAQWGVVEGRANRGFVLARMIDHLPERELLADQEDEEAKLFVKIAQARVKGELPDVCTQQELTRRFETKLAVVMKVLHQLSALGLVERKAGNGWSFLPSIDSAASQKESYGLRLVLEPALMEQPDFQLDLIWAQKTRARHEAFAKLTWRPTLAVEFYEINADFHEALAAASRNRYMLQIVQQQNTIRRFLNYHWDYGVDRVSASIHEHMAILSALEAGERQVASVLMRRHLENARDAKPRAVSKDKSKLTCC
jgi:DNA-binding GntR family transcriptional regulator